LASWLLLPLPPPPAVSTVDGTAPIEGHVAIVSTRGRLPVALSRKDMLLLTPSPTKLEKPLGAWLLVGVATAAKGSL